MQIGMQPITPVPPLRRPPLRPTTLPRELPGHKATRGLISIPHGIASKILTSALKTLWYIICVLADTAYARPMRQHSKRLKMQG
jgi:hypothetical protein